MDVYREGFSYIITKKHIHRASADVGFIMTAYNLRRIITIIGMEQLKEYFRSIALLFQHIVTLIKQNREYLRDLNFLVPNRKSILT